MRFEQVYERFSPLLSDFGSVMLAGGCVRDQLLGREAKDFDLFVLSDKRDFSFEDIKKEIGERIEGFTKSEPTVEWHNSEPYLVAAVDFEGAEVQIMVNPAKTPHELMGSFDWSVSLFTFDGAAIVQGAPIDHIRTGGTMWLNKVTFPLSTLRRGFRFSERFKMKIKPEDIEVLCREVLAKAEKGKHVDPDGNEPDMPALAAQMTEYNPF